MTLTATRPTSRYHWVPAAAGWLVGIIATLSLIASVSPLVRWIIKVPREFVNDYIFNFPDTSFAWAFVLALLAAALAARKRIAWWILVLYMVAAVGWNVGDLITGDETVAEDIGEVTGLVFHVAAIIFLFLARKEFWAKVRRGALVKAAAVLVVGMAVGILLAWGLLELFPGTLDPAMAAAVRHQPGERFRHASTPRCSRATRTCSSTRSSVCSAHWR